MLLSLSLPEAVKDYFLCCHCGFRTAVAVYGTVCLEVVGLRGLVNRVIWNDSESYREMTHDNDSS